MNNPIQWSMGDAFATFFKIGLFTIGGGYAMIPLIEKEVVEKKRWIDRDEFLDLMAVAQSAPGVFAVNLSIFIGYKRAGVKGSVACAIGNVMPSVLIILLIALFFQQFKEHDIIENVFKGIRPAVVALILVPTFKMARTAKVNRYNVWIPIVTALLIWMLGVSPIYVIMVGIAGGIVKHWSSKKGGEA
ncbi:MAG: chromate transporter [Bacteroidaceae bacterium]|nr:chromate transporter [Bacteroidaceae bacterium]